MVITSSAPELLFSFCQRKAHLPAAQELMVVRAVRADGG